MATIPASFTVTVLPSVLNAGGNSIDLNCIVLTENWRVPVGEPLSFPTASAVSGFFGPTSDEASLSTVYFNGFDGSTQKPGSLLFSQYHSAAVSAYMLTGPINELSLAELKALSGSLSISVDGYTWASGSISLAAATSQSSAAAIIQAALISVTPTAASVTASIAPETVSFTGSIAGYVLTVSAVAGGGLIVPGMIITGAGVSSGTMVTSQLSGDANGVGTYAVQISQVVPSEALGGTYGLLSVTNVASGSLSVGQTLSGSGVTLGTQITGLGTGTGLLGTYYVTPTQTVGSEAGIIASGTAFTVTYDSVSGGFLFKSGIVGPSSLMAFATGTLAASIFATQSTGAILSQGAAGAYPATFMGNIAAIFQNWATFMTLFDPDVGTGNAQKLLFAEWVNGTNDRFAYLAWDTDITPTLNFNAPASLGAILASNNSSGTCCIYDPTNGINIAAFVAGAAASIDFSAFNGRITYAFKHQTGLPAGVTSETVVHNLIANGYNYYGANATANQEFVYFYNGGVSGPFRWLDSYTNQIWMNSQLQLAILELFTQVTSIPYNTAGSALIEAACLDPINQALRFGAIRTGINLSMAQIAEVNNAAGVNIAPAIQQQGWYLQIGQASPQVRAARGSPPCLFFYSDGEAVQTIRLSSIDIL